jgi:hypothetical protein
VVAVVLGLALLELFLAAGLFAIGELPAAGVALTLALWMLQRASIGR